jgi:hypothetical protein
MADMLNRIGGIHHGRLSQDGERGRMSTIDIKSFHPVNNPARLPRSPNLILIQLANPIRLLIRLLP